MTPREAKGLRKNEMKATYIWQMATKWGRGTFLFYIFIAFLAVSLHEEPQNTIKNIF
jgi:hypothetical protein